jgi:hypothetical protein
MSQEVTFRVDERLGVLVEAIMRVRGETPQDLIDQALMDYLFKHIGMFEGVGEVLEATYAYVLEQQKEDIAPLLEMMEKYRDAKAAEEVT